VHHNLLRSRRSADEFAPQMSCCPWAWLAGALMAGVLLGDSAQKLEASDGTRGAVARSAAASNAPLPGAGSGRQGGSPAANQPAAADRPVQVVIHLRGREIEHESPGRALRALRALARSRRPGNLKDFRATVSVGEKRHEFRDVRAAQRAVEVVVSALNAGKEIDDSLLAGATQDQAGRSAEGVHGAPANAANRWAGQGAGMPRGGFGSVQGGAFGAVQGGGFGAAQGSGFGSRQGGAFGGIGGGAFGSASGVMQGSASGFMQGGGSGWAQGGAFGTAQGTASGSAQGGAFGGIPAGGFSAPQGGIFGAAPGGAFPGIPGGFGGGGMVPGPAMPAPINPFPTPALPVKGR
jgi:hypothetical protein